MGSIEGTPDGFEVGEDEGIAVGIVDKVGDTDGWFVKVGINVGDAVGC